MPKSKKPKSNTNSVLSTTEYPDWHRKIVEKRVKKYSKDSLKLKDWDEVQKNLDKY